VVRIVIFVLAIAFVTALLFWGLSGGGRERACPPGKPVRVEDGSCTPKSFFEATFVQRAGQK
jgi:hypothetical protein